MAEHSIDPELRTLVRAIVAGEMSRVPTSLPALRGLPVACELSTAVRDRYGK